MHTWLVHFTSQTCSTAANRLRQAMNKAAHVNYSGPTHALTVEEVAYQLRVGRTTIFYLIKTGQLASMTVGRSRRISARALAEFIAKSELNSRGANDETPQG